MWKVIISGHFVQILPDHPQTNILTLLQKVAHIRTNESKNTKKCTTIGTIHTLFLLHRSLK